MSIGLSISFKDKSVLLVGGGKIGEKKIKPFVEDGANITVISEKVNDTLLNHRVLQRKYQQGDEDGYYFVIIATNNEQLNCQIANQCEQKNILYINASGGSRVSLLAQKAYGDIKILVSTNGKNPTFAKWLLNKIKVSDEDIEKFKLHTLLRVKLLETKTPNYREIIKEAITWSNEQIKKTVKKL